MTIAEDVLRARQYGRTAYYQAIQAIPSYKNELERTRTDFNGRTWFDWKGYLPKFTTKEFEKRREEYQAKYGNQVNIPGFNDIIHIIPKAKITLEEMSAHKWAQKRKLPSPLTPQQLQLLLSKKVRFLRALATATPKWLRTYGAVATALDNVEDSLVILGWLGRIAIKVVPRLLGRLVPVVGWVLLGADMFNAVNLISWATFAAKTGKRHLETLAERNPFHAKAKASRALKLKRAIPSFGEYIELLQVTDQQFGFGLCLGGIMGMITDLASKPFDPKFMQKFERFPDSGEINEIVRWGNREFAADARKIKGQLIDNWQSFKNEAYRLKEWDIQTREDVGKFIDDKAKETWGWISSIPERVSADFAKSIIGSMIISTGKDDFLLDEHTKAFMMLSSTMNAVMPWWNENDPIAKFKDFREYLFAPPGPTDPVTLDLLQEGFHDWKSTLLWPHLETEYATIEEITYAYAPMIKDSFQTYCLDHQYNYTAMVAAQECVDFMKKVLRSYSDDGDVQCGMSAYWAAAEDMVSQIYLLPPTTPQQLIDALGEHVGQWERETGQPPPIHELASFGESIGIEWMRSFPRRAFDEVADAFPEWQAIQDQIGELFVMD